MLEPRKMERILGAFRYRVKTGCGNAYVIVTHDDQGLAEVFMVLGKSGGCAAAQIEAICRIASLALRSGIDPTMIVKHLRDIQCPNPMPFPKEERTLSCADGIAKVLIEEIEREKNESLN